MLSTDESRQNAVYAMNVNSRQVTFIKVKIHCKHLIQDVFYQTHGIFYFRSCAFPWGIYLSRTHHFSLSLPPFLPSRMEIEFTIRPFLPGQNQLHVFSIYVGGRGSFPMTHGFYTLRAIFIEPGSGPKLLWLIRLVWYSVLSNYSCVLLHLIRICTWLTVSWRTFHLDLEWLFPLQAFKFGKPLERSVGYIKI